MLGDETTGFAGTLDLDAARQRVREISDQFGFHVNPDALVEDLPVGVQQRVEIIKALSRDAQVLVLDEPTAVLTPQETDELMQIMRELKEAGKSIVFITHKLREVREVADKITVIRLGKVVGEAEPTASNAELASLMVGSAGRADGPQGPAATPARTTLVVEGLRVFDDRGPRPRRRRQLLHPGRRDPRGRRRPGQRPDRADRGAARASRTTSRARSASTASELLGRSVRQVLDAGVGFIPEDRQVEGLVGDVHDRREPDAQPQPRDAFVSRGTLQLDRLDEFAKEKVAGVRRPRPRHHHRWPASSPAATSRRSWSPASSRATCELLVAAQPTRGVDVGLDRVHPQADRRGPRRRRRRPGGLHRARRGSRARRPDHGALPGPRRRHRPGDTPREVLGLMMTGERPEGAIA